MGMMDSSDTQGRDPHASGEQRLWQMVEEQQRRIEQLEARRVRRGGGARFPAGIFVSVVLALSVSGIAMASIPAPGGWFTAASPRRPRTGCR
jgi:hypothetical protein